MIYIQTRNGNLDLYDDTEIQWSWTAFRFQTSLRDPYSNDIQIPKSTQNLKVLDAIGLLDSKTQMFGSKMQTAILYIDAKMIPIFIQVVSVDKKEITICLYEDTFPYKFKDFKINDLLHDSVGTIYRWNKYTLSDYGSSFIPYDYGCKYNGDYAQIHPVKRLRNVMYDVLQAQGVNSSLPPNDWWLLATKKTICPQNTIQVVEFNDTSMDGGVFNLHGGQHVSNGLSMNESTYIEFNRYATTTMKIYVVWRKKQATYQNKEILIRINGQNYWHIPLHSSNSGNMQLGVEQMTLPYQFNRGDTLSFYSEDMDRFQSCSVIVKIEYGFYNITEDDYGQELEYVGRLPRFRIGGDIINYMYMDGTTIGWGTQTMQGERLSFAYFGYYCNLPDMTIGGLFHSLQWVMGRKIKATQNFIEFVDPNEAQKIEGLITKVKPSTSRLGQKNYIVFKDEPLSTPVSTIQNEWLEKQKKLHESIFNYNRDDIVHQYENPSYDSESETWSIDFNEIDTPVVMREDGANPLKNISLYTFGLEDLTQSNEVEIQTADLETENKDIIYLDGRKFYIVEGSKDAKSNLSTLTCLCVPMKLDKTRRL